MAIPKLKKQDVIDALKFIDENGVPEHNTSVKYVLVSEDGKRYPPKYVVAVADHLASGTGACAAVVAAAADGMCEKGREVARPGRRRRSGGELHRREDHPHR